MTESLVTGTAMDRRKFMMAGAMLAGTGLASAAALKPTPAARAMILLLDTGGVSQIDSWDPKPSAPDEVRGPFGVTRTRVPGVLVSDLFPRIAGLTDKITFVRTLTSLGEPSHNAGILKLREEAERFFGPIIRTLPSTLPDESNELLRYGNTKIGKKMLDARRRVEAGEQIVVVAGPSVITRGSGWDGHTATGLAAYRDSVAPEYDLAYSSLIGDLADRGLFDSTVVVGVSEFGRAPIINDEGGRHHWTGCWSAHLAGGGFTCGVIGRSDSWAAEPDDMATNIWELFGLVSGRLGLATEKASVRKRAEFVG